MKQLNAASVKGELYTFNHMSFFPAVYVKCVKVVFFLLFFFTDYVIPAFCDKLSARPAWAWTDGGLGKLYSCEWKGGLTGVSRVLPSVVSLNHCVQTLACPSLSLSLSLSGLWILSIAFFSLSVFFYLLFFTSNSILVFLHHPLFSLLVYKVIKQALIP